MHVKPGKSSESPKIRGVKSQNKIKKISHIDNFLVKERKGNTLHDILPPMVFFSTRRSKIISVLSNFIYSG